MSSLPDQSRPATDTAATTTTTGTTRRAVLRASAVAGMGIAISGSIDAIAGTVASAAPTRAPAGYGPLVADPENILALLPSHALWRKADSCGQPARCERWVNFNTTFPHRNKGLTRWATRVS